jgi:sodium-dependent dicarboxylate transporter 2/3/5
MGEQDRQSPTSPHEPREALSPQEERFNRARNTVGLFLGPAAFLVLYFWPVPGLGPRAQVLAAILSLVVTYWVTEPIPIPSTALLGMALCVILEVAPASRVLAPFADPIIFLFMGSFMLAGAMTAHGLNRRFAFAILSFRWVGNSSARVLLVFGAVTAFLSMWISNTATTAMMFPVALGLIRAQAAILEKDTGKPVEATRLRSGTGLMLMAAFASSVGGIGTPVGTPPNLIGIAMIEKHAGVSISFFQWMLFAVPLLAAMYLILFAILHTIEKPELKQIRGSAEYVRRELESLGKWTAGERNSLAAFLVTVVLWFIPGILAIAFGTSSRAYVEYNTRMPESVAAMAGAVLLFILPTDWKKREFTLTWREASRIDWGTLILFGGGLSFGGLMFETKLAEGVGHGLLDLTGATSLWGITLASIAMATLMSEATSNTAAANMIIPVVISIALAAGLNPVPPALGATIGASWGFMLPVATPPNAIVYGSGMVPVTRMIRAGALYDICGIFLIWLGLRVLLPLVGLAS